MRCPAVIAVAVLFTLGAYVPTAIAQAAGAPRQPSQNDADLPAYLRDRGRGISTSMFGTYVREGEWLVYPFFEYYRDRNLEYKPEEFGVTGDQDFRGRYRASEALFLVAHGLTDNLAFEIEAAVIRASFEKARDDGSLLPARLEESGLGDVEGQLRWRWRKEDESRPEVFSYSEVVVPHHRSKPLIGTSDWQLKFGTGLIRGFRWGTLTARAAVEFAAGSTSPFDLGEYAVEYLKRVSPAFRVFLGVEGTQDELSLIGDAQWHVSRNVFIRFNTGVGLTSKATDWTPEVGVVFVLPTARSPAGR